MRFLKNSDFYWSMQMKNLTESKIPMKYGANLFEKHLVALVTDHKQIMLSGSCL